MQGATLKNMGTVLEFFRKHKSQNYCIHEIGALFDMPMKDTSNIISRLGHLNYLRVKEKRPCSHLGKSHFGYIYWKGSRDSLNNLKYKSGHHPLKWVNGKDASRSVKKKSSQTVENKKTTKTTTKKSESKIDKLTERMIQDTENRKKLETENKVLKDFLKELILDGYEKK